VYFVSSSIDLSKQRRLSVGKYLYIMNNLCLCLFVCVAGASAFSAVLSLSRRPLDLDLEEMFTMFDAVDKGQDFDKATVSVFKAFTAPSHLTCSILMYLS
jgi:hypothetical protein